MIFTVRLKGGAGSGNFDHAGRPGLVGGSAERSYRAYSPIDNHGINEFFVNNSKITYDDILHPEWSGVRWYIGDGYYLINYYLRHGEKLNNTEVNGDKSVDDAIENMDAFTHASTLPENVMLYRGIGPNAFKDVNLDDLKGKVITDKGFTSTTLDSLEAHKHAGYYSSDPKWHGYIAEIRAPKGMRVGMVFAGEDEVIFPRDTKFKIIDVQKKFVKEYVGLPGYNEVRLIMQVIP